MYYVAIYDEEKDGYVIPPDWKAPSYEGIKEKLRLAISNYGEVNVKLMKDVPYGVEMTFKL